MNVWNECNKKTYIGFTVSKYYHLFPMSKEKFREFLNDLLLTQLKFEIIIQIRLKNHILSVLPIENYFIMNQSLQ